MADRIGDWIQTAVTKRQFYPLDPRPEEFNQAVKNLSDISISKGEAAEESSLLDMLSDEPETVPAAT